MTPDQDPSATIPTAAQDRPADPRPAWERIAYAWLAREVDAGQPVDPATLAGEVSVAPGFARDLVRVLRAHRQRDPELLELRGRLVRDQITDAYLTRELPGGQPLDPAALAAEVGTTSTVARQWLHTLRAGQQSDRRLASLRSEPTSHGRPTPEQLQALQATYADGGRPQVEDRRPAGWALERIEQLYQTREVAGGEPLDPAAVAQTGRGERALCARHPHRAARRHPDQRPAHRAAVAAVGGRGRPTPRIQPGGSPGRGPRGPGTAGPGAAAHRPPQRRRGRAGRRTHRGDRGRRPASLAGPGRLPRITTPSGSSPSPASTPRRPRPRPSAARCQVRDHCLELAVKAAGGLDHDHGVFGGTLPAERSRLRGNRFPEPSVLRERRELAEQAHQLASQVGLRQAARQLGVHRDALTAAFTQWDLPAPERRVGWQPSRFLTDRAEAERAFQLAEQLGSVNAAAAELGTTWPSLRKAFTRHGLGMPARNPEAVRQRAIAAARQRSGQPATPTLDPVFVALNPGALPARERSPAELYEWVRRDEEYATLGANVVVELNSESHARQPTTRAWAIIRRADRNHRLAGQRASRPDRRHTDRADRASRSQQPQEREMVADTR